MPGHALHGGGVEQIGGVGQRGAELAVSLKSVEGQVELCGLTVPVLRFDDQTRQRRQGLTPGALVVVQHLEQRAMAQVAFRTQRLDQLFERQILMRLGTECGVFDLRQQCTEALLRIDLSL